MSLLPIEDIELALSNTCAECGGTGERSDQHWTRIYQEEQEAIDGICLACHGSGLEKDWALCPAYQYWLSPKERELGQCHSCPKK